MICDTLSLFLCYSVMKVLVPRYGEIVDTQRKNSEFQHLCLSNGSFLSLCLDKNLKVPFDYPPVSRIIEKLFYSSRCLKGTEVKGKRYQDNKRFLISILEDFVDEVPTAFMYPRYTPVFMFALELMSKFVLFIMAAYISANLYVSYEKSGRAHEFSPIETAISIMLIFYILAEVGQLASLDWSLRHYFSDGYNVLDFASYSLLAAWSVLIHMDDGYESARACLAFAAVPMSISLLQFFSVFKSIGQMTIMTRAMSWNIIPLLFILLALSAGSSVLFYSLYYDAEAFTTPSISLLTLFESMLGNFEFSKYKWRSFVINTLSILALTFYMVITMLVLLNLLIAQMTNTFQKINDKSQEQWMFVFTGTTKRFLIEYEPNALCMLPAPLNACTIFASVFDLILWIRQRKDKSISIAGTAADSILEYFTIPVGMIIGAIKWPIKLIAAGVITGNPVMLLSVVLIVPIMCCFLMITAFWVPILYFCYFGLIPNVVHLTPDGRIKFVGVIDEDFRKEVPDSNDESKSDKDGDRDLQQLKTENVGNECSFNLFSACFESPEIENEVVDDIPTDIVDTKFEYISSDEVSDVLKDFELVGGKKQKRPKHVLATLVGLMQQILTHLSPTTKDPVVTSVEDAELPAEAVTADNVVNLRNELITLDGVIKSNLKDVENEMAVRLRNELTTVESTVKSNLKGVENEVAVRLRNELTTLESTVKSNLRDLETKVDTRMNSMRLEILDYMVKMDTKMKSMEGEILDAIKALKGSSFVYLNQTKI